MSTTIKHTAGDRVHVLCPCPCPCTGAGAGAGPGTGPGTGARTARTELDWLPGKVLDAHVLFGRARYVVQLDDDRRLVASTYQIRTRPPVAWAEAAMSEVLDMAS